MKKCSLTCPKSQRYWQNRRENPGCLLKLFCSHCLKLLTVGRKIGDCHWDWAEAGDGWAVSQTYYYTNCNPFIRTIFYSFFQIQWINKFSLVRGFPAGSHADSTCSHWLLFCCRDYLFRHNLLPKGFKTAYKEHILYKIKLNKK